MELSKSCLGAVVSRLLGIALLSVLESKSVKHCMYILFALRHLGPMEGQLWGKESVPVCSATCFCLFSVNWCFSRNSKKDFNDNIGLHIY